MVSYHLDSGTLNGNETEVVKKNTYNDFPVAGSSDKLYIDLSTSKIYHYAPTSGYTQLSNFDFNIEKTTIGSIINWLPGRLTLAEVENNIFKINNGLLPELNWEKRSVVTDVTKEVKQ